jgi:hypothetical protein
MIQPLTDRTPTCEEDQQRPREGIVGESQPDSVALAQARAEGGFTGAHDAFWAAARKRHGNAEGTRALVARPSIRDPREAV